MRYELLTLFQPHKIAFTDEETQHQRGEITFKVIRWYSPTHHWDSYSGTAKRAHSLCVLDTGSSELVQAWQFSKQHQPVSPLTCTQSRTAKSSYLPLVIKVWYCFPQTRDIYLYCRKKLCFYEKLCPTACTTILYHSIPAHWNLPYSFWYHTLFNQSPMDRHLGSPPVLYYK